MPQHTQHSLIHVLLLWTTILSIIQVVFIAFFFSAGHHGLSPNNSAVAPEHTMQIQANSTPSPTSEDSSMLGKGKMMTFQADEVGKNITWVTKSSDKYPVSKEGKSLTIMKDGYYLLILQVTLQKSCSSEHKVSLKLDDKKVLLEGQIHPNTRTTGLLGKVEELSGGGILVVSIEPSTTDVNTTESVTHLDVIYIRKP